MSSIQQGRLRIAFGALSDPIQSQVLDCNLHIDSRQSVILQKCADSITYLGIQGILPDGEVHKARQRLMKSIIRAVRDSTHDSTGDK